LWKYKKSPKARIVGDFCGEILGDCLGIVGECWGIVTRLWGID